MKPLGAITNTLAPRTVAPAALVVLVVVLVLVTTLAP